METSKFLGVGLTKAISLALFTIVVIVVLKTILIKHPIPGVTDVVTAV
ncbi:hypothetical protein [Bacillus sp. ISL-57]|nr:hypothetical protein [Bacillus sp. ISL-57]MBT2718070.1 hypothetical protein [Bacillus sp. ISL-57]